MWYCNEACQRANWSTHRELCKFVRKFDPDTTPSLHRIPLMRQFIFLDREARAKMRESCASLAKTKVAEVDNEEQARQLAARIKVASYALDKQCQGFGHLILEAAYRAVTTPDTGIRLVDLFDYLELQNAFIDDPNHAGADPQVVMVAVKPYNPACATNDSGYAATVLAIPARRVRVEIAARHNVDARNVAMHEHRIHLLDAGFEIVDTKDSPFKFSD